MQWCRASFLVGASSSGCLSGCHNSVCWRQGSHGYSSAVCSCVPFSFSRCHLSVSSLMNSPSRGEHAVPSSAMMCPSAQLCVLSQGSRGGKKGIHKRSLVGFMLRISCWTVHAGSLARGAWGEESDGQQEALLKYPLAAQVGANLQDGVSFTHKQTERWGRKREDEGEGEKGFCREEER